MVCCFDGMADVREPGGGDGGGGRIILSDLQKYGEDSLVVAYGLA